MLVHAFNGVADIGFLILLVIRTQIKHQKVVNNDFNLLWRSLPWEFYL